VRELYVVAVSEDGRHVVLAASKGSAKGTYRIRLDARLVSAVRGDLGAHAADLSPKEIQARLRAGESVEKLAASAGMAVTRVERFAGPVAGEMARMIDEARQAHVVRGRLGRSAVALGKAIDTVLAEHAKPDSASWTTHREDDGRWRVQVAWVARGRAKDAAWRYDSHAKTLEAVDAASAALGHVDANPAPPRRTSKRAAPATAPASASRARAAKPRVAKKAAAAKPKPAAAAAAAPKRARTAAPKPPRTSAAKPTRKAVATPSRASAAKPIRTAAPKPVRAAAPKPKAAVRKPPAPPARPRLQVVRDPHPAKKAPLARAEPARKPTAAERDGVKVRASVPGWADVLLGTTPHDT
jgi:hypothetical protein